MWMALSTRSKLYGWLRRAAFKAEGFGEPAYEGRPIIGSAMPGVTLDRSWRTAYRSTKLTLLSQRDKGVRFLLQRCVARRPERMLCSAARGISTGVTSRRTCGSGRSGFSRLWSQYTCPYLGIQDHTLLSCWLPSLTKLHFCKGDRHGSTHSTTMDPRAAGA